MSKNIMNAVLLSFVASTLSYSEDSVSLKLSVDREPAKFMIGERIPVRLTFINDRAQRAYYIDPYVQLRRDEYTQLDSYSVEPSEHVQDPSVDLDQLGFVESQSGSFGFEQLLGPSKSLVEDLNEYVRFTRPGRYRISVRSRRLSKPASNSQSAQNTEILSTTLALEITEPSPEWVEGQLFRLDLALADSLPNQNCDGVKQLAYLDTPGSVPVQVKWFASSAGNVCHSILHEALLDSRFPEPVIRGLEALLSDPLSSVPADTIGLLSTKILATEYSGKPLSALTRGSAELLRAQSERDARFRELVDSQTNMLRDSLSRRSGSSFTQATAALRFVTGSPN